MTSKVMKKDFGILIIIFVLVLSIRLYMAFQTDQFSSGQDYFMVQQIEHIKETGMPLVQDELSYGGRFHSEPFLFYYIIAFFALFIKTTVATKLMVNLFATSLIFITYLIAKRITKSSRAAIITSFISGFIPIYVETTVNTLSSYSIIIPLMFLMVYFLLTVEDHPKKVNWFIITLILSLLISPSTILLILGLLFYLVLVRIESLKQSKAELELIVFSTFFSIWFLLILYKKAFLQHGLSIIWQNIPSQLIQEYFINFNILEAIYEIGIIPFIFGIYIVYSYIFKEKNRYIYLLIGFFLSTFILLWLKLIKLNLGFIILSIILTLLFSQYLKLFLIYLKKTRFIRYEKGFITVIILIFILTSIIPSIIYANKSVKNAFTPKEMDALQWLRENTMPNSTIATSLEEGFLINYIAKRKNIMDSDFLLMDNIDQRYKDLTTIFTSPFETESIRLMAKYEASYIYLSNRTKQEFKIDNLNQLGKKCFDLLYRDEIYIYRLVCDWNQER